jgi:hypothetical protein
MPDGLVGGQPDLQADIANATHGLDHFQIV